MASGVHPVLFGLKFMSRFLAFVRGISVSSSFKNKRTPNWVCFGTTMGWDDLFVSGILKSGVSVGLMV